MTRIRRLVCVAGSLLLASAAAPASSAASRAGIHKIKHVVVIMQENRSFDSYFGTFPGADGIPRRNGVPAACIPDPARGGCARSFHDRSDIDGGGPHTAAASAADVDGGRMDGFVREAEGGGPCAVRDNPYCGSGAGSDVMGYHDGREIPNYWAYARQFVLQDHLYEPVASWSLPSHLFLVSEWSATCDVPLDPMSCHNAPGQAPAVPAIATASATWPTVHYDWTDLTYLLHRAGVSWRYYLDEGAQPDCEDDAMACVRKQQSVTVRGRGPHPGPHHGPSGPRRDRLR